MRNEEIMMRPKGGKKKQRRRDDVSKEITSLCSGVLVPERHCSATWWSELIEGERVRRVRTTHPLIQWGPVLVPEPQPSQRLPGELCGPLITVNTNFNERLRLPRSCFCGQTCCSPTYLGAFALDLTTISDTFLSSTLIDSQNKPYLSDQSPLARVHQLSFQYFLFNDALSLASREWALFSCCLGALPWQEVGGAKSDFW